MKSKLFLGLFFLSFIIIFVSTELSTHIFTDPYLGCCGTYGELLGRTLRETVVPVFIYTALPFLLAYFFGWKKGFIASIVISVLMFLLIYLEIYGGGGSGWETIELLFYTVSFGPFSIAYFIIATLISKTKAKKFLES